MILEGCHQEGNIATKRHEKEGRKHTTFNEALVRFFSPVAAWGTSWQRAGMNPSPTETNVGAGFIPARAPLNPYLLDIEALQLHRYWRAAKGDQKDQLREGIIAGVVEDDAGDAAHIVRVHTPEITLGAGIDDRRGSN